MKTRLALALCTLPLLACDDAGSADVCAATRCLTAPPSICEGQVKVVYSAVGTCTDNLGAATCNYAVAQRQDCTQLGNKECRDGQCLEKVVVPCENVTCKTQPSPDCDGTVARFYGTTGTCDPNLAPAGQCVYPVVGTLDCDEQGLACRGGDCVDPALTPCDPNPCNVPPLGICTGNVPQQYAAAGTCTEVNIGGKPAAKCDYAPKTLAACVAPAAECHAGACAAKLEAPTAPGDVVFTEILKNPTAEGDEGEWFELFNPTAKALLLDGCVISDAGRDDHTIGAVNLVIPPRGFLVLAKTADKTLLGGFAPDYVYADIALGNTSDELILTCAAVEIDRVAWTDGWASWVGRAMSLTPVALGMSEAPATGASIATTNDSRTAWCDARGTYGDGTNEGSPRKLNPACR
jgi:hypothetical protein